MGNAMKSTGFQEKNAIVRKVNGIPAITRIGNQLEVVERINN